MLRFTLAQMRLSLGRLVAGGLAIVIGTAFLTATLLGADLMNATARNAVAAGYAQADLIVPVLFEPSDVKLVRDTEGVEAVAARAPFSPEITGPDGRTSVEVGETTGDLRLEPQRLVQGRWPAAGEVALPPGTAHRIGARVGDRVTLENTIYDRDGKATHASRTLLVSGLVDDPAGAFTREGGLALASPADASALAGSDRAYHPVLVLVRNGVSVPAVRELLQSRLDAAPRAEGLQPEVVTVQQQVDDEVAQFIGNSRGLTVFVLAFAAVALFVAGLVIANTFQVLVAQRTRTLALLRCVGAVKQQVRRSVLVEATAVGVGASLAGILVGGLLAQSMLLVLRRFRPEVPLPGAVDPGVSDVLLPFVVGTVVTMVAALIPARAATRVSALAALRPLDAPSARGRAGRARLGIAVLVFAGGLGLIALGFMETVDGYANEVLGLALAVLGGAVSFVGVMVSAVFWTPRLAAAIGGLVGRVGGAPAALAAANSVRNPRRTAATVSALLIGTTLVVTVSTAAASARQTLDHALAEWYPVDVVIGDAEWNLSDDGRTGTLVGPTISSRQLDAVRGVAGVTRVAPVGTAMIEWRTGREPAGSTNDLTPVIVADDTAISAVHGEMLREALRRGHLVLNRSPDRHDAPSTVQVRGQAGDPWVEVPVTWLDDSTLGPVMSDELAGRLRLSARPVTAWATLDLDEPAGETVADIKAALTERSGSDEQALSVEAGALQGQEYARVIDTLLMVVLGLLGIAVVIAVLGVANTLALSVIERRRESATLRAIGLTRRQLRWTMAVEGMVIAAVGAVVGIVLGVAYGWAGALTVFAGDAVGLRGLSDVLDSLVVPFQALAATLGIALVAGLLASVLPARSAARSSPIAALGAE